jgi:hypothetical protein
LLVSYDRLKILRWTFTHLKGVVFWVILSRSSATARCFGRTYRLHLQGKIITQACRLFLLGVFFNHKIGDDMILSDVGHSPSYTTAQHTKLYSTSVLTFLHPFAHLHVVNQLRLYPTFSQRWQKGHMPSIFCDVTPRSMVVHRRFRSLRLQGWREGQARSTLPAFYWFLGLIFNSDDTGSTFFRNVGTLYRAIFRKAVFFSHRCKNLNSNICPVQCSTETLGLWICKRFRTTAYGMKMPSYFVRTQNPYPEIDISCDISRQGRNNSNLLFPSFSTGGSCGSTGGMRSSQHCKHYCWEQKPSNKPTTDNVLLRSVTGTIHTKLLWVRILISLKLAQTKIKNINDDYLSWVAAQLATSHEGLSSVSK